MVTKGAQSIYGMNENGMHMHEHMHLMPARHLAMSKIDMLVMSLSYALATPLS
jgi:hypothetical protein